MCGAAESAIASYTSEMNKKGTWGNHYLTIHGIAEIREVHRRN